MQDAVDRVPGVGMARQVIEDFRRGRGQRGFVWHTLQRSAVPLAPAMPGARMPRARLILPALTTR